MKRSALLRDEPDVLASFRYRNRSLYVDETQDMNPLQFMLLRQMAGDDPDLFCVGDPNQSIYGFNGANPSLINDIIATWPDTVILDLTRNHRSTANIIAVANTLLEEGARGIEPAKDDGEVPLVRDYDTDDEEAASRRDVARGEAPAREPLEVDGGARAHERPARARLELPRRGRHSQRASRARTLTRL